LKVYSIAGNEPNRGAKGVARIDRTVLVEFTCARMFALVDEVESYPAFLPWCSAATVEHRDERVTRATVHIDYRMVKVSFATENAKLRNERIDMRLLSGPFRRLNGAWRFTPLGDRACKVQLELHYEFASRLLEKVVGPVFDHIANSLVDAFVRRAQTVAADG